MGNLGERPRRVQGEPTWTACYKGLAQQTEFMPCLHACYFTCFREKKTKVQPHKHLFASQAHALYLSIWEAEADGSL